MPARKGKAKTTTTPAKKDGRGRPRKNAKPVVAASEQTENNAATVVAASEQTENNAVKEEQTNNNMPVDKPKKTIGKKPFTKRKRCFYDNMLYRKVGVPRMRCITYEENRETGDVKYGVSNYRRLETEYPKNNKVIKKEDKKRIKKELLETATWRLNKNPGTMNYKAKSLYDLHNAIREAAFRHKFADATNNVGHNEVPLTSAK